MSTCRTASCCPTITLRNSRSTSRARRTKSAIASVSTSGEAVRSGIGSTFARSRVHALPRSRVHALPRSRVERVHLTPSDCTSRVTAQSACLPAPAAARPSSPQLSVTTKRHAKRHVTTKMRHVGPFRRHGASQKRSAAKTRHAPTFIAPLPAAGNTASPCRARRATHPADRHSPVRSGRTGPRRHDTAGVRRAP